MVFWIFSVVAVGLVAILIQMLLVYQKKAYDLSMRQAPIRKKIKEHVSNLQELTKNIRRSAGDRVGELDAAHRVWAERIAPLKAEMEEVQKAIPPMPDPAAAPAGEAAEIPEEDSDTASLRKLVIEAKNSRLELDTNLTGIERDTLLVKRTLEQMEAKLKRAPGGGKS